MPTDHACQAAAEEAARGITPVRALLSPAHAAPAPRPAADDEDVPVMIRQYLGGGFSPGREANGSSAAEAPSPEPVGTAAGGAVLLTFLEGLRADLGGTLVEWYAELMVRVPHALSVVATVAPELEPPGEPSEWKVLSELKTLGQELLTVLARLRPNDRVSQLSWRLALVEDAFAGALRRLDVPPGVSARAAADVAAAAGSLFGMQRQP
ncbi:hypothetical protein ACTWP5_13205 [Streptomyces sp. 4N509B]|uniref:hypothetical protein n=1 Tax=Streptomyces sp. 4N509B TaxID=3457413 RepID=UPI003FD2ED86